MPTTGHSSAAPTGTTSGSTASGAATLGPACPTAAEPKRQDTTAGVAELICADPQWLGREFAELIAANYPPAAAAPARTAPPRRPRVVTATGRRPIRDRLGGAPSPRPGARSRQGRYPAPTDGPARQRSPPTR